MGQLGLFDLENRLSELSKMGDPLEKLDKAIDWRRFRKPISKAFRNERKSNAGRPPYDYILMFKILVLQSMYGLADGQTQFHILDRLTFRRFLGIGPDDTVPDEKTIWLFRETMNERGVIKKLFDLFERLLDEAGFRAQKGQIVDASFVEVPRQRNSRDENDMIKKGDTPPDWEDNPDKLCQKDTDARWTKKNDEKFYGYKNHVNVDAKHKLIREYAVTPANVHDSQVFKDILYPFNTSRDIYADSAYSSDEHNELLKEQLYNNRIHKKGRRGAPLSTFQQKMNTAKSRIRVRVEHVFGQIGSMGGGLIRCIGQPRAAAKIGLMNLVYNFRRYSFLTSRA